MHSIYEEKESSNATTIDLEPFTKCLEKVFKNPNPDRLFIEALYHRFKPVRSKEDGANGVVRDEKMDIVDFLLAMNLLSRTVQEKKIKLMFELCDLDDDGCMNPPQILQML